MYPSLIPVVQGHLDVLRILHACGIDMGQADEDGTSPVHIAAANGNLDVLKFMHENGVNMEVIECVPFCFSNIIILHGDNQTRLPGAEPPPEGKMVAESILQ